MPRSFRATTFAFAALAVLISGFSVAHAESIYVSPSAGSYSVGQTFSVRALVSSPTTAINAVSGTMSFPTDKLQVLSVSKSGSAMSLWVTEPSFSNVSGTVDFAGVVLNPGFTGSAGTVLTVNFRVVKVGAATVSFSSGSLLANDGSGTDILKSLGSGTYTLSQAAPTPPVTEQPVANKPQVEPLAFSIQDMRGGDLSVSSVPIKVLSTGGVAPIDRYEFQIDDATPSTWKPDDTGIFTTPNLIAGKHLVRGRAYDSAGTIAYATLAFEVNIPAGPSCEVKQGVFGFISSSLLGMLAIVVPIIALIVLMVVLILHALRKSSSFRDDIEKEVREAESILHQSFEGMRQNLESYVEILEEANAERRLTDEEKKLFKMMRQNINDAEKIVGKEVGDIEKISRSKR